MTMPDQEVRALSMTREFLHEISVGPRMPTLELRKRAASCLHHYPAKVHIDRRWEDDVCEHGSRMFCRVCGDSA